MNKMDFYDFIEEVEVKEGEFIPYVDEEKNKVLLEADTSYAITVQIIANNRAIGIYEYNGKTYHILIEDDSLEISLVGDTE